MTVGVPCLCFVDVVDVIAATTTAAVAVAALRLLLCCLCASLGMELALYFVATLLPPCLLVSEWVSDE